jgi:hypothetical protein
MISDEILKDFDLIHYKIINLICISIFLIIELISIELIFDIYKLILIIIPGNIMRNDQ